jgi:hypothetical protein
MEEIVMGALPVFVIRSWIVELDPTAMLPKLN